MADSDDERVAEPIGVPSLRDGALALVTDVLVVRLGVRATGWDVGCPCNDGDLRFCCGKFGSDSPTAVDIFADARACAAVGI